MPSHVALYCLTLPNMRMMHDRTPQSFSMSKIKQGGVQRPLAVQVTVLGPQLSGHELYITLVGWKVWPQ